MNTLKRIAGRVPGLYELSCILHNGYTRQRLMRLDTESVFTDIYRTNAWNGSESVSGRGSDLDQTKKLIRELPLVFREYSVSTMLDIPCGDFHWMSRVDLGSIAYTGADIVGDLVEANKARHERERVRFVRLDLLKGELPHVDLVMCRDCLVHLSFADIRCALENVCHSGAKYLLATTFTARERNRDIATGQWRVLNLERAPIELPRPLRVVYEGCTERSGAYADKALGLWAVADIKKTLGATQNACRPVGVF